MIRIYETRVTGSSHHPKLGLLCPGELRPLDEDVAAAYCDRSHQVPGEDGELVEQAVDGILQAWTPESPEAIAKSHRRDALEALAPVLGVEDPGDTDKFPNKTALAAAIFKALPARPKKVKASE
jgi:hypothetical protein